MRLLFEIDTKDYNPNGTCVMRPSCRCVAIQNGKVAMIHSLKYDYYKFPGGGIEQGETKIQALIRETLEETGLHIVPDSIREFGYVHRVQKGFDCDMFVQDNYYYLCEVSGEREKQNLDDYEEEERFTLEWVTFDEAIAVNHGKDQGGKSREMVERESRVLAVLKEEMTE